MLDDIVFEESFYGKLQVSNASGRRKFLLAGLVLMLAFLLSMFLFTGSSVEFLLLASTGVGITVLLFSFLLKPFIAKRRTLQLTEHRLAILDKDLNEVYGLELSQVLGFEYFSSTYDDDDLRFTLRALLTDDNIDFNILNLWKRNKLLLELHKLGYKILLVYEQEEFEASKKVM